METARTGRRKKLLNISFVSLFAALIAAGTFMAIPIGPVPIVLQNFFVLLAGLVLGPLRGGAAVGLFLLAGILGAPVFAGFTGGITRLAGPTGGFLIGYLFMAILAGLIAGPREKKSRAKIIIAAAAGLLSVYIPGIAWLKFSAGLTWGEAMAGGFLPFIAGDVIKGIAAVLAAPRLRRTAADFLNG